MEQARISNMSPGPCEKIFKAFNIIPALNAMRRISDRPRPQSPLLPETAAAASPVPAADPAAPKTKLAAQRQPDSAVPIVIQSPMVHLAPSNEKEKLGVNVTPKLNGEMAVQEKRVAWQAAKASRNSESLQKPKPGAEMPTPSNVTVEQSHGQEAQTPHISYQVKPVTKVEKLVEQGQQKVVTRDKSREQDSKTAPNTGDHRFTDFINRTMLKIRATSDVGKSSSLPDIKKKSSSKVLGGKSISFKK